MAEVIEEWDVREPILVRRATRPLQAALGLDPDGGYEPGCGQHDYLRQSRSLSPSVRE
jgi:hypothetical protein